MITYLNLNPINNRYVDNTLASFDTVTQANSFLQYINSVHQNIKFTVELESQNKISFLDILIMKTNNAINTNVFSKNCFTGQGLNYYSLCHDILKINSCLTLINTAYHICTDWFCINKEFEFLEQYFKNNCSPSSIFHKTVNKFLNLLYQPKSLIPTVPKKIVYFSFPYLSF